MLIATATLVSVVLLIAAGIFLLNAGAEGNALNLLISLVCGLLALFSAFFTGRFSI